MSEIDEAHDHRDPTSPDEHRSTHEQPERDRYLDDEPRLHSDEPRPHDARGEEPRRARADSPARASGPQDTPGADVPPARERSAGHDRQMTANRIAEHDDPYTRSPSPDEPDRRGAPGPQETPARAGQSTDRPTALISPERAREFQRRWTELKGDFVEEPRYAVRQANNLVGEVLDELEELFRVQRGELEHGLDDESTTTEDLRRALRKYRSFFDRLLSF
jgi:hypothetical protein